MSGLIGVSNNSISGVAIIAVLCCAILIFFMLSDQFDFNVDKAKALSASGITIILGGIMACAAALSNDTLQDLKSGQLVGATPWKQQLVLLLGVLAGAVAITRSEEHTSELQSLMRISYAVSCLQKNRNKPN